MTEIYPRVSIILVNYNGSNVVLNCLKSLRQYLVSVPYEIIVVDNCSTDKSADLIEQTFTDIKLIRLDKNLGFGAGNNLGVKNASGDILFLLNTDTLFKDDILPRLLSLLESDQHIGIVGPRLLNADGSFQLSTAEEIGIMGEFRTLKQVRKYRNSKERTELAIAFGQTQTVDIVVGAALLIRKVTFEKVGGFDENFFMYFEESDLCQRVRDLGLKVVYTPEVSLVHIGGYSVGKEPNRMALEYRRSQLYYYQKHRPVWEQIILRFYLFLKFLITFLKSFDVTYLRFISVVINLREYPVVRPNPNRLHQQ
ncbi:MAG: glycosyltransferase family 2 protein [Leptolyngbyaceae cyanobacterium MO_188.B28]|nr:glycosyltransferase family 2 protein [Leptolyngbyaceae cyanobacterium MO_188.B28]